MYLAGDGRFPAEYGFLPLDEVLPRAAGRRRGARPARASTARTSARLGPSRRSLEQRGARRRRRPPPRQHALRRRQPRRRRRVLDRRDRRATCSRRSTSRSRRRSPRRSTSALVTDTGRFQYANTTPKALRLAAELVEAGADVHDVFKQVYETVQFAKLKLLARALDRAQVYEGGRLVVSYLLRSPTSPRSGRTSRTPRGSSTTCARAEGARARGADPRAAADRGGPTHRISLRSSSDEVDVSAIARASGGGGHRQAAGFSSERRSTRSSSSSAASSSPRPRWRRRLMAAARGYARSGVALVDKPAGPSSFALVAALRRRTRARTGHTGTLDPFATGLLVLLSGSATRLAPCFVGLDKRYVTDVDLTRDDRRPATRRGRRLERHRAAARRSSSARLEALRGEVELPIPAASAVKIGGERAYRLARRGIEVEMPLRRSQVYALDVIAYTGDRVAAGLHVGSGTYVRRSRRPSAATARRCGGRRSGRSGSRRPTRSGCCRCPRRSRRLPAEALERVPERAARPGARARARPVGATVLPAARSGGGHA